MDDHKNLKGIASRITAIRKGQKFTRLQMAEALNLSPNAYTKYERALNFPSFKSQAILSEKFGISLDWLLLNKGVMYLSEIEKIIRENQVLKQEQEKWADLEKQYKIEKQQEIKKQEEVQNKEPVISADGIMVTDADIKELIRFMEDNPLFKHQLLVYFYRFRQGKPGNQVPEESPFE
jgi:transcriptional regulator with XRE-family HTH domain